jgi:hypothetical protein
MAVPALAVAFCVPAAACSVLALANGPVGPTEWGSGLIELRESGMLGPGGEDGDDTLVVGSDEFMIDQRGEDLALWELRGGRVCAASESEPPAEGGVALPDGVDHAINYRGPGEIELGSVPAATSGRPGSCPYIADGARADPAGAGSQSR